MKRTLFFFLLTALLYLFQGCQANGQQPQSLTTSNNPVPLHEGMLASTTGRGESHRLVDAPDAVIEIGKPIKGGAPWDPAFQENGLNRSFIGAFNDGNVFQDAYLYYPLEVVIDLEQQTALNKFCLTDLNGEGLFSLSYLDKDKAWKRIINKKLNRTFEWICFEDLKCNSRFLKLTFADPAANVGEIRLFSNQAIQQVTVKPPPTPPAYPTFKTLVGVNINTEDPIYQMSLFEFVREYHDWHLEIGDNNPYDCQPYRWNPSNAYAGWSFDKLYDDMTDAGVVIAADLKGNIPALQKHTNEDKPISKNGDPQNPQSYAAHAEYLYQFAARYGSKQLNPNSLSDRVEEEALSGLDQVKYIENWNEQDKFWIGRSKSDAQRASYFHPFEYAAMLSADYDGHEQTVKLKTTQADCQRDFPVGIKLADPNIKVVMSGITGLYLDYVKGIHAWAKINRKDGRFPADVINFHHYSNNFGGQAGGPGKDACGISPEADNLYGRLKKLVDYRNAYLPEQEIWLSEFGYDVHPRSPQRVPLIGNFDAEEVQGQWLVRSFLAIAAAGIDKAQLFTLTDHYHGDPAQRFSTCGLLELAKEQNHSTPFPEFRARKAYYYLYAMKQALRDFRFQNILKTSDPRISVYEFEHQSIAGKKAYAVWANTSTDYRQNDFSIMLGASVQSARLIELVGQDLDGKKTDLKLNDYQIIIPEVSERPVFVITDDKTPDFSGCAWNIRVDKTMIKKDGDFQYGDPAQLIDEPTHEKTAALRQPICGKGGTPINSWIPLPGEGWPGAEVAAIIDLKKEHLLKGISIFDGISQGWLKIEIGQPDNWQLLDRYRTTKYNEWKHWLNMDIKTRYLRITCEDPGAVINEIVLLGQ